MTVFLNEFTPFKTFKLGVNYFFKSLLNVKRQVLNEGHPCWDDHVHPDYTPDSGSNLPDIKQLIYLADKRGLSAISMTPHHSVFNLKEVVNEVERIKRELDSSLIVTYGMEIDSKNSPGIKGGHMLVHFWGVNPDNAKSAEMLPKVFKDKNLSLEELIQAQDKLNDGHKVIRGYSIPEEVRQGLFVTVMPAHYLSEIHGVGLKSILNLYKKGFYLHALEITNSLTFHFKDGLARVLNCCETGGSDAHYSVKVGGGYTILKKPGIDSDLDIFDCILNRETSTNYFIGLNNLKKFFNINAARNSNYYFRKFIKWYLKHKDN